MYIIISTYKAILVDHYDINMHVVIAMWIYYIAILSYHDDVMITSSII